MSDKLTFIEFGGMVAGTVAYAGLIVAVVFIVIFVFGNWS